jgi:hypothetical protein
VVQNGVPSTLVLNNDVNSKPLEKTDARWAEKLVTSGLNSFGKALAQAVFERYDPKEIGV